MNFKELDELSEKLIIWLNDNCNPHTKIVITSDSVELLEGVYWAQNDKHIKD